MPRAILIAGPTASGKSSLAIDLARRFNGVVINTDSMQIYRDLQIITARPTPDEEREVPHELFGYQDAAEAGSVARWLSDAKSVLDQVEAEGRLPIFVGGTGLYFRALVEGLSDLPPVPEQIRSDLRIWAADRRPEEIHDRLRALDPETAARLHPRDPQRNLRALEIVLASGRPLASFQRERQGALLHAATCVSIFLAPDRDMLRTRINARFDAMMAMGALEEVAALKSRSLDPALPAMRAHGVPALIRYLKGDLSREEAIEIGKGDTRRYAKRQHTWFRHQAPWFEWIAPATAFTFAETLLVQRLARTISD